MGNQKFTINQLLSLINIFAIVLKTNKGFVSWFISNILSIILIIPFIFPIIFFFLGVSIPHELFLLSKSIGVLLSPFLAYHIYHGFVKILDDYSIHFLRPNHVYFQVIMYCILTLLILKTLFYSWNFS